jgi:transposase InsO family protein
MSRTGDCWNNAVAESFFSTIKRALIERTVYATHDAAVASIADIERFYNLRRCHSHLDYISEPARVSRRLLFLEGEEPWRDRKASQQRCESGRFD